MKPVIRRSALFGLTVFALAIGGAQAQIQGEGPVAVTSNDFTFEGNVAVYRGAVEAVQGQTRLRCSVLRVHFQPRQGASSGALSGGGNAERYDCAGPVYYVTPTEQAKSDTGVFMVASNTIVLTGNVTVQQGQNVAQGDKLTINTRTKATQLEANNSKRVRTVIYPDQPAAPGRPGGE